MANWRTHTLIILPLINLTHGKKSRTHLMLARMHRQAEIFCLPRSQFFESGAAAQLWPCIFLRPSCLPLATSLDTPLALLHASGTPFLMASWDLCLSRDKILRLSVAHAQRGTFLNRADTVFSLARLSTQALTRL